VLVPGSGPLIWAVGAAPGRSALLASRIGYDVLCFAGAAAQAFRGLRLDAEV
jgi:hypothetical protein